MTSEDYPPFRLGQPRFDQATFLGRLRHFLDVIDPSTLLVSNMRLQQCIQLLDDYKKGTVNSAVTDKDLWEAQKIKQAIIHPDTGEKIFMPFRMSGFVPFGFPIVTGLLLPNPTLFSTIFWQWLNQSHNACVNYANRNASKQTPLSKFAQGYLGAVTSAVSIAVGLSYVVKRADRLSPAKKMFIQRFIPFPAVATASTCNVVLMRFSETQEGIDVLDANGSVVGTSKVAAKKALTETAVTRAFLPAPILIIPPIIMSFLERLSLLKRKPSLHLPINAFVVMVSFGLALPVAISIFPQTSKISVDRLEDEIRSKVPNETFLFYNKGL